MLVAERRGVGLGARHDDQHDQRRSSSHRRQASLSAGLHISRHPLCTLSSHLRRVPAVRLQTSPTRLWGMRCARVHIVLEVLIAVCRAFNCKILYGLYLPTVIHTIIWYSITHSLFHPRLKTFLFCKSFPPQPFLFLLQDILHGFPGLFTVISEHICFLLLVFLFFILDYQAWGSGADPGSWQSACRWCERTQLFNGLLPGTTSVTQDQKKHSPTHIHPGHWTSFVNFLHLLWSIASCLFSLCAWQSVSTTSLQVLWKQVMQKIFW